MSVDPHEQEQQRLAELARYGVLEAETDADLQALAELASLIVGVPAAVNFIGSDRQFQAANTTGDIITATRAESMCDHVVASGRTIALTDAREDEGLYDNPFVSGVIADIWFYIGTPLTTDNGHVLGTLCVFDADQHPVRDEHVAALRTLAKQVVAMLELRRRTIELERALILLEHDSHHDPLTGLANRVLLADRMGEALARLARTGQVPTLLFCDLDGFKKVNDCYGHDAGDEVLTEIALRLRRTLRPYDVVARIGGDEFVVLVDDGASIIGSSLLDRMEAEVRAPVLLKRSGTTVRVGVSIGNADATAQDTAESWLARADTAMYRVKSDRISA